MSKTIVIAAPWSNSGKTTFTLALCRLLKRQGLKVQPFKCGPDYIDTLHHSRAAGTPSINLDTVMMSEEHVQKSFRDYASNADVAIVEGVMGLFDGAPKGKGSTADIAKLLDLPIVLIMDARSMAYSVAPLLHGLKTFDPQVKIAGVVFNFVKTESHYAYLKDACEEVGLTALGYLPPNEDIKIPSRHLGLLIEENFERTMDLAASHVEAHIAVDLLLDCGKEMTGATKPHKIIMKKKYRIAVARDDAFSFTYFQNLKKLEALGEILWFSPLYDNTLPEADILYLSGGYPELHLENLSANKAMKEAIAAFATKGGKILAECGGMMFLGNSITNEQGEVFPMVGIFDFNTSMINKKLTLGYRKVRFGKFNLTGHEFRYSSLKQNQEPSSVAKVYSVRGIEVDTRLYRYNNVLASYIHFYWAEGDQLEQILHHLQ